MFVLSYRPGRGKVLAAVCLLLAVIAAFLALSRWMGSGTGAMDVDACVGSGAATDSERIEFLSQFGWEVDPEPVEMQELTIPQQFSEVYRLYNEVQKAQGMDLAAYAGKKCTRYTYRVTNYPDYPHEVRANLIVYENEVIGGDICSVEIDGFLCTFDGKTQMQTPALAQEESSSSQSAAQQPASSVGEIPASAWPVD